MTAAYPGHTLQRTTSEKEYAEKSDFRDLKTLTCMKLSKGHEVGVTNFVFCTYARYIF